jgi:FdrA protein
VALRGVVWRSTYHDSMVLMRIAEGLRARPGVREAAVLMGTAANHALLAAAGLATPDVADATAGDLIIAVDAGDAQQAQAALDAARGLFDVRRQAREATGQALPRTLDSALRQLPDANLATISLPGAHAAVEARRALRQGLHVFLFSDNVSVESEIELKRLAVEKRLLCMGPDCGTAYLNGVGLGFANVVPRGRIGCVAASGTGLQAVASHLAALGEGISHGIGVGGRDLSAEVGGLMTFLALDALRADAATELVVLISKPVAPSVRPRLDAAIRALGKPVVVCCLGASPEPGSAGTWVSTLEDAAHAAAALAAGRAWAARDFSDAEAVRVLLARLAVETQRGARRGEGILGLYTGGTLAHETTLILEPLLGTIAANFGGRSPDGLHQILDLGADEFTAGRPHPMIDPSGRALRVREAGRAAKVGVLLLDLVLGRAAHDNPAEPLAAAISDAREAAARDGRVLTVVASIVGTEQDPQGLRAQTDALESAGAIVLPSNAQAARFAAGVARPELAAALLGVR